MRGKWNTFVGAGALTVFVLSRAVSAEAQAGQQGQPPSQQQPPADKDKQPNPAPLSMDNAPAASPEEDSASKAVQQAAEPTKRIQLAEEFLQNGPIEKTACLILDVRMPGMSGLELQRALGLKLTGVEARVGADVHDQHRSAGGL